MVSECSGRPGISFISHSFSFISCVSWIFAQLPQILNNYQTKSTEGISPSFLLLWFLGDFLSFTSCLLNDATLGFQLYLSIFFLCNDVTLCFQYYYYSNAYPKINPSPPRYSLIEPLSPETVVSKADLSMHSEGCNIRHTNVPQQQQQQHTSDESTPSSYNSIDENRNMLKNLAGVIAINAGNVRASGLKMEESISTFGTTKDTLGLVLAWGCTLVYCSSRCPQLYKNYKRKSVEGISPLLFGSALVGNLTYTLSILTSCSFVVGHQRAQLMYQELPYILGSSGTIIFDLVYFYQKRLYKDKRTQTTVMRLQRWSEIEHVNV